MAIFMTCTTTMLRLSLASSPAFSAAWMASFLVSATECMAHNFGKEHNKGGGLKVMTVLFGRIERLVVVAFILGVALAAPIAESQDAPGQMASGMASSNRA